MSRILVAVLISVAAVLPADAQAIAAVAESPSQTNVQTVSERINVAFDNTLLSDAIYTVARRSGARVTFDDSKLPEKRVTYRADGVAPETVLSAILSGTGLRASRTATGTFKLVRTSSVAERAQGMITGKITDGKTGRVLPGVNVSLDAGNQGVITGEDGSYRLTGVPAVAHTVAVRLLGYAKQTQSLKLGEGATITADFKLEPSANVLDQVIVTGTVARTELRAVPNAITVVTAKQIEERGITRIDQLFRGDIPGLFALNAGTDPGGQLERVTMFSRGATALSSGTTGSAGTQDGTNPIKTYLDGVELVDPRYISQIDPSSIERIEILTGPQASTIYGANAINGVMQIFTKRGTGSRLQARLNLNSGVAQNNASSNIAPSHLADANVSGGEGRVTYNIGGSWNYVGAWTPSNQTQRLSVNGAGKIALAKVAFDMSARRGLTQNKARGSTSRGETNLRSTGVWSPLSLNGTTAGLPFPQKQSADGQTFGLAISYNPLTWWSHDLVVGSDGSSAQTIANTPSFSRATAPGDSVPSISSSNSSRLSERYTTTVQLPMSSLGSFNLTLGGEHWRTKGSSWSASPLSLTGSFIPTELVRNRPGKNSSAFVQTQFAIKDALFVTYGVSADWNPNFGDDAKVKPGRYGVSYSRDFDTPLGSLSTKFRGSYGRSIRPPNDGHKLSRQGFHVLFGTYDVRLASPDLGAEHQQGGEGGIELYFGARASLVVTRYNQTVANLISQVSNVDSARSIVTLAAFGLNPASFPQWTDGYGYQGQSQYLNVGNIRNQGWETQGSINIGRLTTRGTYSWVKSRVIGITPRYRALLTGTQFQRGRSFDYLPEHTWAMGFTYAHSSSTLALAVNGIGTRYISSEFGGDPLWLATHSDNRLLETRPRLGFPSNAYRPLGSGYTTADLNAMHRVSSRMEATLQVNNITDYYPSDFGAFTATMGRQSKVGVRIRFQ